MIEHSYLQKILDYNPETGDFIWKVKKRQNVYIGKKAGNLQKNKNYWRIGINRKTYKAHILA